MWPHGSYSSCVNVRFLPVIRNKIEPTCKMSCAWTDTTQVEHFDPDMLLADLVGSRSIGSETVHGKSSDSASKRTWPGNSPSSTMQACDSLIAVTQYWRSLQYRFCMPYQWSTRSGRAFVPSFTASWCQTLACDILQYRNSSYEHITHEGQFSFPCKSFSRKFYFSVFGQC